MSKILWPEIYQKLGIKPVINARSWATALGGSLMQREVLDAMEDASKSFIDIVKLHKAAGKIIAKICKSEAAMVTSGCAAGQVLMSAACITGNDKNLIKQLPNPSITRKEMLIFKGQRNHYDSQFEMTGAILKEFGTTERVIPEDLHKNIDEKTCAIAFADYPFSNPGLGMEKTAEIAHEYNIPLIVDGSSRLPPVDNIYKFLDRGADMVAFSGGKGVRGPNNTGFIAGKHDLIEAAFQHMICFDSPKSTIGRAMKVSKESIVGLVTALEMFIDSDQEAIWSAWRNKARFIIDKLPNKPGLEAQVEENENRQGPQAILYFDENWKGPSTSKIRKYLLENDPSIYVGYVDGDKRDGYVGYNKNEINIFIANLQDGEEVIISDKLNDIMR